jgi:uncharacterized RDD family membrane protein YckC
MNFLICPNCSEQNLSNRLYCSKCGVSLKNAQVQMGVSASGTPLEAGSGATGRRNDHFIQERDSLELIKGAGCGIRLLARVIDLVTHYIVGIVAILFVAIIAGIVMALLGMSSDTISQKLSEQTFLDYVLIILGFILYHTFCEGVHGATLGKLICGLVVIKEGGRACNLLSAFGRSLGFLIDSLFFCIPASMSMSDSEKQQRLGDRWAKTMVVKHRDLEGIVPLRSGLWFGLAFFSGILADGALAGLSVLLKFVVK